MKNMKNKWIILAGAVALTAFSTAQATPINGAIDMSGTVIMNNTALGSATAALGFSGVAVTGGPSGSYSTVTVGDAVTWHAFGWPSGSASPLWSFTDAGTGWTYSFNLATDSIISQSDFFLNLLGTGTLTITGGTSSFDPTAGAWSFTVSNPNGGPGANAQFSFANSQTSVPDGGTTAMLLGIALSGVALLKKKLTA